MGRSSLLHWNCRGFKATIGKVDLIQRFNALVLCLQETYLKDVNISFFRKYSFYNKIGNVTENKVSGEVTIMVNKSIPRNEIRLNSKMQAVAMRSCIPKTITKFSIYLYPNLHWETKHLEEVFE